MPARRILSLWFPRLGAERLTRQHRGLPEGPLATVSDLPAGQVLVSLSASAEAAGLAPGQPLRDARAMCPDLVTRTRNAEAEAAFLAALARWAGRFSPWVAPEPPAGLMIDLTGAAHLFGGEKGVLAEIAGDCARLGLSVQAGIADTPGGAWALARHAGGAEGRAHRTGDAIEQEARATRSRAAKRHWTRGGTAGARPPASATAPVARIAAPGQLRQALAPLPLSALRLEDETLAGLARLGLRRVEDVLGLPRAALARRFGQGLVRRLDQALGLDPEPLSPVRPAPRFAVRLTLPEPIGLAEDIMAGIDRLIPALCDRLAAQGRGARRLRLTCLRADHGRQVLEMGLARPAADPDRLRPLLMLKLAEIDPGFGIDALRLEALQTEPLHPRQHRGHLEVAAAAIDRRGPGAAAANALDDLIGRLGARIGMEAITRLAPADSHIPEKAAQVLAAAWSDPAEHWPARGLARPLLHFPPEPVAAPDGPVPPARFRWRRRMVTVARADGPERIAPEWWLDDPAWRSGPRDYWRVETEDGARMWLYRAEGAETSAGWFCQGTFA